MTTLYIMEGHAFVSKRGGTLVVKRGNEPARTLPLERVTDVVCCGDISWSGAALRELAEGGVSVAMMGPHDEWVGRWEPQESKTIPLRRAQFRAADDAGRASGIARGIVAGKIRNSRALLVRARREGLYEDAGEIDALGALLARVDSGPPCAVDVARGIEGEAASIYFPAYGRTISRHGFIFTRRSRRPPADPANALLSFGYALLAHAAGTAVRVVGFDAHVGFLHADRYGRESLALDLIEEFRAPIVDALVAAVIHRRVISAEDFEHEPTGCRLKASARRAFIEQYERKLADEVLHPVLGQRVTHRRALEIQARILAKHLTGELDAYVSFSKR
jgi:CRISPR-associated protein Cas1